MARFGSFVMLLLVACSGGDKDPTTPPGDDDDDNAEDTAHTAEPEPEPKLVAEIRFRASIAWDSALGTVVNPAEDGDEGISAYVVDLYEAGWSADDETSYCEVVHNIGGLTLADGVAQEGFLWGIDIPSGLEAYSECLDDGFAPEQFDGGDPVVHWAVADWQLRFGGEPSADLVDWLTPDPTTSDFDINHYAAGGWSNTNPGYETDPDDNYWYAYAMGEDHEVDFDTLLTRDLMTDGNGEPVTAYFRFDQRVVWNVAPPE